MKEKLKPREKRFLKAYMEGKPLWECAKYAGSKGKDKTVLAVMGLKWLKAINLDMSEVMDMQGLTDDFLGEKLREGLSALDRRGNPDGHIRSKYMDLAGKFKGRFKTADVNLKTSDPLTIQLVGPDSRKDVKLHDPEAD